MVGEDEFSDLEDDFFDFLFTDVLDYFLIWWFLVYIV